MVFRFPGLRYLDLPRLGSSPESHTEVSGSFSQNVDSVLPLESSREALLSWVCLAGWAFNTELTSCFGPERADPWALHLPQKHEEQGSIPRTQLQDSIW